MKISWLRAKLDSMTDVPVLIAGDEDDFYPGEVKDFVLSAVKKRTVCHRDKNKKIRCIGGYFEC